VYAAQENRMMPIRSAIVQKRSKIPVFCLFQGACVLFVLGSSLLIDNDTHSRIFMLSCCSQKFPFYL